MPGPPWAVYRFWNMASPANIRPRARPMPPPVVVSMRMLGLIQLMLPRSVIMASPLRSWQMTTGRVPPSILYSIVVSLLVRLAGVRPLPPVYQRDRPLSRERIPAGPLPALAPAGGFGYNAV